MSTGGFQNVDVFYTPGIDATTSFQFGATFSISYSALLFAQIIGGPQATPGGPVTGDFTNGLQLVSLRAVNADGHDIPGAVIHSELLDMAAPEPDSILLCGSVLLFAGLLPKLRKPVCGAGGPTSGGRSNPPVGAKPTAETPQSATKNQPA